jgi:hypothetical protein
MLAAFRSQGVFSSLASRRIQKLTSINNMFLGQDENIRDSLLCKEWMLAVLRSHGVFSSLASSRIQMLTSINKMFL